MNFSWLFLGVLLLPCICLVHRSPVIWLGSMCDIFRCGDKHLSESVFLEETLEGKISLGSSCSVAKALW